MNRNIIVLLSILSLAFILVSGCSSQKSSSVIEKEYDQKIENTKEIAKEGYVLTSNVFVPKGTFLGKAGGEFGDQIQKVYVAKDKRRVDQIYSAYEIRVYILLQNGMITTTVCNNKEGSWKCNQLSSIKQQNADEKAFKELDLKVLNGLKKLEDKKIIELNTKCFENAFNGIMCFHPNYQIILYDERPDGFTSEATALEFQVPNDGIFELPISQNSNTGSQEPPALPEE